MPDETGRNAARLLAMVSELHARGYQLLRISPGMAPSGMYWRTQIAAAEWIDRNMLLLPDAPECVWESYTSGAENRYFDWREGPSCTVTMLADLFEDRFPEVLQEAKGRDWSYVGWYLELLGHARRGHFPVAYSDGGEERSQPHLPMTSVSGAIGSRPVTFPWPPHLA